VQSSQNRDRFSVASVVVAERDGATYAVAEVSRRPQPWSRKP
jgi:hypothetical protein